MITGRSRSGARCLLCVFALLPALRSFPATSPDVEELLRNRIEAGSIAVGDELIYASAALPLFYERRGYLPAWIGPDGDRFNLDNLLRVVTLVDNEGLRSGNYHLKRLENLLSVSGGEPNPRALVDIELLATDAFLTCGSHLLSGMVNPETIDPEWFANRRGADMALILQNALDAGSIEEAMQQLLPPQQGYMRLRGALARYREIQARGGWPSVGAGEKIEPGSEGERVVAVRTRLMMAGDLRSENPVGSAFDETLQQAVRKFQSRHGLDADGIVGASTIQAMDVPVENRIRQVIINLERWRWLPQELGERHILVNIANFELDVVEQQGTQLTMRVVVGKDYRRTPVFSDRMTYLVFNPSWHVPPSIAVRDKLPEIRKNPGYLPKQRMHLYKGWGAETVEIDPDSVDWSRITAKNFPYRIRQDPGPLNALGQIKFMFPNKFNIYLHDTPSRELFSTTVRAFSSGCIRVQRPLDLATYLLRDDKRWSRQKIEEVLEKGEEQTVRLTSPVPVHLLYWTAWAEEDGTIQFRPDIYGRDTALYHAMREIPPSPESSY